LLRDRETFPGNAHQTHQVLFHILHQIDHAADHLSREILEILGHEHVREIAPDGLASSPPVLLQELPQLAAQLAKLLRGELAGLKRSQARTVRLRRPTRASAMGRLSSTALSVRWADCSVMATT
jgi:hypothetical protein